MKEKIKSKGMNILDLSYKCIVVIYTLLLDTDV